MGEIEGDLPCSLSLLNSKTTGNPRTLCGNMYKKQRKKATLKKEVSNFTVLVLNQSPISAVSQGPKIRTNGGFPVHSY